MGIIISSPLCSIIAFAIVREADMWRWLNGVQQSNVLCFGKGLVADGANGTIEQEGVHSRSPTRERFMRIIAIHDYSKSRL